MVTQNSEQMCNLFVVVLVSFVKFLATVLCLDQPSVEAIALLVQSGHSDVIRRTDGNGQGSAKRHGHHRLLPEIERFRCK